MIEKIKKVVINVGQMMLNRNNIEVELKGDVANLVTNIDKNNQKYLIEELSKILPNAKFFAEEKENQILDDEYTFVIDPIDGTTNFTYDYKHSAVSVGLVKNKECIMAICYNPYLNEIFMAKKGEGAYLNGKKIEVTSNNLKNSLVLIGTAPYNKEYANETFDIAKNIFLNSKDIRRSGSAVLDICYVACGRADAFYEKSLSFWDYCAASLILTEAKGKFLLSGNFGEITPVSFLASNKENEKELLKLL